MTWRGIDLRTAGIVVGGFVVAGLVGAVAVVSLGLYNVSARDGHWPGVSWVLHTTFENSADLRAPPKTEVPEDLDTPGMVALGAGHYMSACAMCHGAPGVERSATVLRMNPIPPRLDDVADHFTAAELAWVVHNGVKMTGMPGWPGERSDDVWPVVAFLRALPGLDAAAYADMTTSDQGACTVCHGPDGRSENPRVPRLDILSEAYIARSLEAYHDGRRDSGIMAQALSGIDESALPRLVRTFGAVAPEGAAGSGSDAGRDLAVARDGSQSVPACVACHGPWPEPLNAGFPSLAGQHAPYLEQQLTLWREGNRGGGAAAELMYKAAKDLSDAEIAALAGYYAGLAPAELNDVRD